MGSTIDMTLQRKRAGRHARTLVTVTAIALGAGGLVFPATMPVHAQSFDFTSVRVEGNQRVDASTILSYAGISRGEDLSAGMLNDAYKRIVASGLFEEVEVEPQGSTLVIRVKEFPFLNVVNFEGNRRIKDDALAKVVQSKSRRAYSPAQAVADAAAITALYRDSGRMAATVNPKIIRRPDNRVDLVFEITEGKVTEIERLSFVGNRAFSDRRLRQVLQTKQAGWLRLLIKRDTLQEERLEIDKQLLTDFYHSRGFIDFEVLDVSSEVSRERDASFLTFTVREGQRYSIGKVSTVSEIPGLSPADFVAVQKISPGQTWSPQLIDNEVTRMENLALKKGLNFVRVEPRMTRDSRNQRLNIEFAITKGERIFVERIDIEGNATTQDQVIRRQFRTVEGDPFNPREIRQSAERIRALGFFSDVNVDTKPGSTPEQVVVSVDVEEKPTGSLGFGISYGKTDGFGFNISLSESNFLGRGQALAASISTTRDNNLSSFRFTEPALLGRDLSFDIGIYYETSDSFYSLYNLRNWGANFALGFPLAEESRLSLKYSIARNEIYDYRGESGLIYDDEKRGTETVSMVGYQYEYDNRITGINPDTGLLLQFGQNVAGLGGDAKYVESNFFAMGERDIMQGDVTVRAIFEGAYIKTFGGYKTRITDRFTGNGHIRGFEPHGIGPRTWDGKDALGGNAFIAARFESEFPLGLPEEYGIKGGAFLDMGSVWSLDNARDYERNNPSQFHNIDDGFKPRVAVGVSVLWDTPLGPLRFNFAKALKKEDYDREQVFDLTVQTKF